MGTGWPAKRPRLKSSPGRQEVPRHLVVVDLLALAGLEVVGGVVLARKVHHVVAVAALDLVGHLVAPGLRAGVDGVVPARADQLVLALAADDQVVAVAAVEGVDPSSP